MTIYLVLLVVLLFFLTIARGSLKKKLGIVGFIAMIVICGLRGRDVGTDTFQYHEFYAYGSERMEPLFIGLRNVCTSFNLSTQFFLFIVALCSYIPLIIFLSRESNNMCFSALIYLCFSVMFFHQTLNTVRACIAMSFMLCGLMFFREGNQLSRFLFFSCISILFHYSAIIIVVFVLILNKIGCLKFSHVLFLMIISILIGISFTKGFSDLADRLSMLSIFYSSSQAEYYQGHFTNFSERDWNLVGLLSNMLPFSLFCILLYNKRNSESLYYRLFVFGCFLQNALIFVGLIYRITMYLTIFLIVLLPNSFAYLKNRRRASIIALSSFMVLWYVYQCFTATVENRGLAGGVPYVFFYE